MTAAVGSNTNVLAYLHQLQYGLGSLAGGIGSEISSLEQSLDPAAANVNGLTPASGANGGPGAPFSAGTFASPMSIQEQLGGGYRVHGPSGLFAKLDADGDGQISQSEFESALNDAGVDTQSADALFSHLDSNGDGSISESELPQTRGRHHHHHGSDEQSGGANSAEGGPASLLDATDLTGAQTQTTTNADGSTATTTFYSDGSSVLTTTLAAQSASASGNGASSGTVSPSSNNFLREADPVASSVAVAAEPGAGRG